MKVISRVYDTQTITIYKFRCKTFIKPLISDYNIGSKNMSKGVTPQSENYNTWYTDVVTKADLADYGPVKGTMVVKPYGFAMWDLIKETFDKMIKDTGHVNAYSVSYTHLTLPTKA